MASVYQLKPAFQGLLRPKVQALAAAGVTANQVTVAALGLSLGEGLALALWPGCPAPLLALPLVLLARMALNAVDGMLAREHGQKSALGGILNEATDVAADAALYLPLGLHPAVPAPLVVVAVVLAGLTEVVGLAAIEVGASRRYDGPMGKSDRAVAFGALALGLGLGRGPGPWVAGMLGVVVALSLWTLRNRALGALGELGGGR